MKVVVSKRQRRLLVRVAHSQDLIEALEDLADKEDVRRAWVRGVGTLERATLEHLEVDEPCEVLSLEGGVCWDEGDPVFRLRVTLAPLAGGALVVGGVLKSAPAIDVDLFVECFDDLPIEVVRAAPRIEASRRLVEPPKKKGRPPRSSRRESPERASAEPRRARRPSFEEASAPVETHDEVTAPPTTGGAVSWADVAAASSDEEEDAPVSWAQVAAASEEDDPEPEEDFDPLPQVRRQRPQPKAYKPPPMPKKAQPSLDVLPSKGDFVQHRQFGLCKIEKTDGRGGIIIKLKSGVRKTIRLDYMDVGRPRDESGRTVYPLRPRKR